MNHSLVRSRRPRRLPVLVLALSLLPLAGACDGDPVGVGDEDPGYDSLTVDASAGWALVALGDPASTMTVADPGSSDVWDMGFFATSVMLNGGAAGPGGVVGYCLCQQGDPSDAEVMAMTAESELDDFLAVSAADLPADDAWVADELAAAISGWYDYDVVAHAVTPAPDNVWLMRSASGGAWAKIHVVDIQDATQTDAGKVTFELAVQTSQGAPFDPTVSVTLDAAGGAAYLDLETGAEVGAADDWDVMLEGWDVRVNGGVSGDGQAGAVLSGESFAAITDASNVPAVVYAGDAFGGAFVTSEWYRYDLAGGHQIWPTFQVFLVRRGDTVYKVQLVGYYGEAGASRQITFRYAPVE